MKLIKRGLVASLLAVYLGTAAAAGMSPDAVLGKKDSAGEAQLPTVAQPAQMDPKTNARLVEISRQLRCLVCQNESIAESTTEVAADLRNETARMIREGKSDSEIIESMVERYGEFVLYNPAFKANTWLLWLSPVVFFLLALIAIVKGAGRRRQGGTRQAADSELALAAAMLRGEKPFDAALLRGGTKAQGEA